MLGLPERCVLAWDPLLPVCPLLLLTEWEVKALAGCALVLHRASVCQSASGSGSFTLKKLECLKQALSALNTLAWDNGIGPGSYFRWFPGDPVMINGDGRGDSYLIVRGEILRFIKDALVRKRLTRTFSSIKNES
jgi:hypothetical protein